MPKIFFTADCLTSLHSQNSHAEYIINIFCSSPLDITALQNSHTNSIKNILLQQSARHHCIHKVLSPMAFKKFFAVVRLTSLHSQNSQCNGIKRLSAVVHLTSLHSQDSHAKSIPCSSPLDITAFTRFTC